MAKIVVAMIRFQSFCTSPVPIILVMPMTIVSIDFDFVISSGQRYWFQP